MRVAVQLGCSGERLDALRCGFVQIGVAIVPGSTIATCMPERRELEPERVGHRLERELRHRVRAEERQRRRPPIEPIRTTRPRRAAARQERLEHAQLADDVDVELPRQLVGGQELERRAIAMPALRRARRALDLRAARDDRPRR
jgi:hypothetical protein